jgi:dTMP kinase
MKIEGGYLVAIEGIDAIGKNTHSNLLYKWLGSKGFQTTLMSFPDYHTPIGKEIRLFLSGKRDYPLELQHILFAANRWEKAEEINSLLSSGEIIMIDRYTSSNLAYGKAKGLDVRWLAGLEKGLPEADLVLVLDAPPGSLRSRRPSTSKDVNERSSQIQAQAQKAYRELSKTQGWKLINAVGSIEDVQEEVLNALRDGLKRSRGVSI